MKGDDFLTSYGTTITDAIEFGNSWKVNPECDNASVVKHPCVTRPERRAIAVEKCSAILGYPFNICSSHISATDEGYLSNCEYDMCSCENTPVVCWCQALNAYASACARHVDISWLGMEMFAACSTPCASLPCFNGGTCANMGSSFECRCPPGFVGDRCELEDDKDKCKNELDLGFMLDSSSSVGYYNFNELKRFVKILTSFYRLSPNKTRVSVMSFSFSAHIHIRFSQQFFNKQDFYYAVDRISYRGGGTATASALSLAHTSMFTSSYGARGPGVKKVLLILTDGGSSAERVSGPAQQLKNAGIVIFSVGIRRFWSLSELSAMASEPAERHVFQLSGFSQLRGLAKRMSSETCHAFRFRLLCESGHMTAVVYRNDLPEDVDIDSLHLRDPRCRPTSNSTHVVIKTALTGCGTRMTETEQTIVFRNVFSSRSTSSGRIISRNLFQMHLACSFPRKITVGAFSFEPARSRIFVNSPSRGNFTLTIAVFKDSSYSELYTSRDFPISILLSEKFYIQYALDSSDRNLVVRAETCRATPSNRPYDQPQYIFIDHGCDRDQTITHYTYGINQIQRFSIQAFRFLTQHRLVYIHCDLVVCNANNYTSICARSTTCTNRKRRDVDQGSQAGDSQMYGISFGPVVHSKASKEKSRGNSASFNAALLGSLVGAACFSLISLLV